jgi:AcrR family transcriptional regulator
MRLAFTIAGVISVPSGPAVTTQGRRQGRPRDAGAHRRILDAAIEVFVAEGWRGFSITTVARAAKVGKSTVYLRWSTREELIVEALETYGFHDADRDTGSVREDLRQLALSFGQWLDGPSGPAGLRIMVEGRTNPEFAEVFATIARPTIAGSHRIIRRAKERGELSAGASATVILDALLGGIIHHMISSLLPSGTLYSSARGREFIDQLVDYVLATALVTNPA